MSIVFHISGSIHNIQLLFMVHLCKMITSPGIFFHFFKILMFLVVKGVKWQKIAQNDKKSVCLTPYLKNCTLYDCGFWYTCVKWWYLQQFFHIFSKFWFIGFLGGGGRLKGQEMTHNYQFQSVTLYISRTYNIIKIISLRLLVCRCKIMISQGVFLYFFFFFFDICKY